MTSRTGNRFGRPWMWILGAALVAATGLALAVSAFFPLRPSRPSDYREPARYAASNTAPRDGSGLAVYVPVYSHIYHGGGRPHLLEVTLSIRNLEVTRSIRVHSVDYYDTNGEFIRSFIETPVEIRPLGTVEYLVPQGDISGGSGANFIVTWAPVQGAGRAPLIQAVMVGREGNRSFSFICTGVALDEAPTHAEAPQDGDGD